MTDTARLRTELGVEDPDGFYAKLIELHNGLTTEESVGVNAKMILIMANHIGDRVVLDEMLASVSRAGRVA